MPFPLSTMMDIRESHNVQRTPTSYSTHSRCLVWYFRAPSLLSNVGFTTPFQRITSRQYSQNSCVHHRPLATPTSQHTMPLTTPFPIAHQQGARTPLSLTHTYIQTHNNHQHQKHPHNVYSLFDTKEGLNPMCIVLGESDWVRLYSETTNITKSIPINNQQ